jgi:hypothetical protein
LKYPIQRKTRADHDSVGVIAPVNLTSQSRRLIALEVRIVFGEQKALQQLRFAEDVIWYTLPFHLKKVRQPINCLYY